MGGLFEKTFVGAGFIKGHVRIKEEHLPDTTAFVNPLSD